MVYPYDSVDVVNAELDTAVATGAVGREFADAHKLLPDITCSCGWPTRGMAAMESCDSEDPVMQFTYYKMTHLPTVGFVEKHRVKQRREAVQRIWIGGIFAPVAIVGSGLLLSKAGEMGTTLAKAVVLLCGSVLLYLGFRFVSALLADVWVRKALAPARFWSLFKLGKKDAEKELKR